MTDVVSHYGWMTYVAVAVTVIRRSLGNGMVPLSLIDWGLSSTHIICQLATLPISPIWPYLIRHSTMHMIMHSMIGFKSTLVAAEQPQH